MFLLIQVVKLREALFRTATLKVAPELAQIAFIFLRIVEQHPNNSFGVVVRSRNRLDTFDYFEAQTRHCSHQQGDTRLQS